jgi:hypothetical protein
LTPGHVSHFDDGHARGEIRVNSLGQRDAEPAGDKRILLAGDSFAFGALLDQGETIDRAMERRRPGLDVYNLGVSGYNLPHQLVALQRCTLAAEGVVYLFFGNDLEPPDEQTVVDGYRLIRFRGEDGALASDAELRRVLRRGLANAHASNRVSGRLPLVRQMAKNAVGHLLRGGGPPDDGLSEERRSSVAERGARYTLAMREEAARRGAKFAVAILPAIEEVKARAYRPSVARYAEGLRRAGVAPIELLSALDEEDYWVHNPHLNPRGSGVVARALLRELDRAGWNGTEAREIVLAHSPRRGDGSR